MQHCHQRKDSLLAVLRAEGPLQPLPALGSSHPFSKAQVCHIAKGLAATAASTFDCSHQL
jgi:hypothetical protein